MLTLELFLSILSKNIGPILTFMSMIPTIYLGYYEYKGKRRIFLILFFTIAFIILVLVLLYQLNPNIFSRRVNGSEIIKPDSSLEVESSFSSSEEIVEKPIRIYSEKDIPSTSNYEIEVSPNNISAFTSGPVCLEGLCVTGGEKKGNILILLSSNDGYIYSLSGLIPFENWHGVYEYETENWQVILDTALSQIRQPGNCTGENSCDEIEVLVFEDGEIIYQNIYLN